MTSIYLNISIETGLLTHFSGCKKFFRLETKKIHFPEHKKLFKIGFFLLFELEKLLPEI